MFDVKLTGIHQTTGNSTTLPYLLASLVFILKLYYLVFAQFRQIWNISKIEGNVAVTSNTIQIITSKNN